MSGGEGMFDDNLVLPGEELEIVIENDVLKN